MKTHSVVICFNTPEKENCAVQIGFEKGKLIPLNVIKSTFDESIIAIQELLGKSEEKIEITQLRVVEDII